MILLINKLKYLNILKLNMKEEIKLEYISDSLNGKLLKS